MLGISNSKMNEVYLFSRTYILMKEEMLVIGRDLYREEIHRVQALLTGVRAR